MTNEGNASSKFNKHMKIGILTYPLNNNYGCYLQSYALLHFLQENGYDVEYIMRRHDKPSWKFYIKYAIKNIANNIVSLKWKYPFYDYEWHYMVRRGGDLLPFYEHYIAPHTQPIYTTKSLSKVCSRYDVIIVGSDQVWRAEILSNITDYFLCFDKDDRIVKIAYAASFGKDSPGYTPFQKRLCGKSLSRFKAVSVRETIGLKLMKDYGWSCPDAEVVLDPTMLLFKNDYLSLIKTRDEPPIVFAYILDQTEEKISILKKVAERLSLNEYNILKEFDSNAFVYPSVEKWLSCYASASFIVTDSFHGTVFAILFNVPFVVVINEKRGSARFETLLDTFKLKDRVVSTEDDLDELFHAPIEWNSVNDILRLKREESKKFILKNVATNE